jgi:hypothetical protein
VDGKATITLDGSRSDDGDAGTQGLLFQWTLVSGPATGLVEAPAASSTMARFGEPGTYTYELRVDDGQPQNNTDTDLTIIAVLPEEVEEIPFRRGVVDASGSLLQITDAVQVFNFLFLGGPSPTCLDAADADDNGTLNLTDGVRILNHLFLGSGPLPGPGPGDCGQDPTPDDPLGCAEYSC